MPISKRRMEKEQKENAKILALDELNHRINTIYKEQDLTYKEIAKELGISLSTLKRIRKGYRTDTKKRQIQFSDYSAKVERLYHYYYPVVHLYLVYHVSDLEIIEHIQVYGLGNAFSAEEDYRMTYEDNLWNSFISENKEVIAEKLEDWSARYNVLNQAEVDMWIRTMLGGKEEE